MIIIVLLKKSAKPVINASVLVKPSTELLAKPSSDMPKNEAAVISREGLPIFFQLADVHAETNNKEQQGYADTREGIKQFGGMNQV